MNPSLVDQVREIVADALNVTLESVREDSSPSSLEAWDSLQHLNIVLSVEQAFGLSFSPNEMQAMTDVAAIVAAIQSSQSNIAN